MSGENRARHRRAKRASRSGHKPDPYDPHRHRPIDPDAHYRVCIAIAETDEKLPEARQQAHDAVIAQLGDARRGPVQWMESRGAKAIETLETLQAGSEALAMLESWPDAVLVVAMAQGEPDAAD